MGASKPEFRAAVILEAGVSASEDPEKVLKAMGEVVGDSRRSVTRAPASIRVESDEQALVRLRDQLRDRRVRAAARRLALARMGRGQFTLMLNRQAAYAGVIALCSTEAESPLGPIFVTVKAKDTDAVVAWLTDYEGR